MTKVENIKSIEKGFSEIASEYDRLDAESGIMQWYRSRVRDFCMKTYIPGQKILELNGGSGLDAVFFANKGLHVTSTDVAPGMVESLAGKIQKYQLQERIASHKVSFEEIPAMFKEQAFDHIFSNFGGLNCVKSPWEVLLSVMPLLKEGGTVTAVVMPPVSWWEIFFILKGNTKLALRRWSPKGTIAHVEGSYFRVYYFRPSKTIKKLKHKLRLINLFSLGCLMPPPSYQNFAEKFPKLFALSGKIESVICRWYPFSRCGDYVVLQWTKSIHH